MESQVNLVADLIFGRWRSQVLFAGVELGVFDHLEAHAPKTAATTHAGSHYPSNRMMGVIEGMEKAPV